MAASSIARTFMYFSYGSNLLMERIVINNPSAQFQGVGTLRGFRFTYDVPTAAVGYDTDYWFGATATVRPGSPEDYVCGVIWEIDIKDLEALDNQEIFYQPIEVDVENAKREVIKCRTYEMDKNTLNNTKPSPHYKKVIIAGAMQSGLPEEYIRYLESFPDNGVTRTPPLYEKVLETVRKFREQVENGRSPNNVVEPHILDLL